MRYAIIGDLHGRYDLLISIMMKLESGYGLVLGKDIIVFLGDYFDRGTQNKEILLYLSQLKKKYGDKIVLLRGNHDQLAYEYLTSKDPENRVEVIQLWMHNGGYETLNSFTKEEVTTLLLPFLNLLELYYETDDFICVHGGIPIGKSINTATENELLWNRDNSHYRGKQLIVGHSILKEVKQFKNTLYLDTGAFSLGTLSAIIKPYNIVVIAKGIEGGKTVVPDVEDMVLRDTIIKDEMKKNSHFCTWVYTILNRYYKG
jgi:serine/threonine protein phosphatase 1